METTPLDKDLKLSQKTTKIYEMQFKKDGIPVDITDWIVFFTLKENMNDTDDNAKIKKTIITHEDATNGKSLIQLSSTDTDLTPKSYYYDIKVKDNCSPANIVVIVRGRITVEKIVTRRESA